MQAADVERRSPPRSDAERLAELHVFGDEIGGRILRT
jgi:hypothetical protein